MTRPTHHAPPPRAAVLRPERLARATLTLAAAGALLIGSALVAPAAHAAPVVDTTVDASSVAAASAVKPSGGAFVVKGAGFGHGHGMSQYGAYGAAEKGLSWKEILGFYYPGTTLKTLSSTTTIKVWITADDDNNVRVMPNAGLKVYDSNDHSLVLPTGDQYRSWRIKRSGAGYTLSWKNASGTYTTYKTSLDSTTWHVSAEAKRVRLRMPDGSTREYRGTLQAVKRGSGLRTVNKVKLEDYVRGVVPSEMPTSWATDAVRAQAVAARSYAIRIRDFTSYSGYDICDTTACQVYRGKASTSAKGTRTVRETTGGDAATKATAGTIVTYGGQVALTQFASSNGGAMSYGGYPYLREKDDPYDGVVRSQAWTRTITTKAVARAYPSVGTVKEITITKRDGSGHWGGRVITIKIVGSKKTLSTTGSGFQGKFGMRSSLYTVTS